MQNKKLSKPIPIQTYQLPQLTNTIKQTPQTVQLPPPPQYPPQQAPPPQQSFSDFMKQKLQNSEIRKVYEDPQPAQNTKPSKPFQIKQSQTSSSTFTNKKPYTQFYQPNTIRTISDSRPQSEKRQPDHSYISTEKSEVISNDQEIAKSDAFSLSKSSNELTNSKFVDKKRQHINYDSKQWVVNQPKFANKEYRDIMNQVEELVKSREQSRQTQLAEVGNLINQTKPTTPLPDEQDIEKLIQFQEQELDQVEKQDLQQKTSSDIVKFHQIVNDSQLSQLSVKQRSMFLTELLRHREQFKAKITGQEEEETQEEYVQQLEKKVEKQQEQIQEIVKFELPKEYQQKLELLIDDNLKINQSNPFIISKDKLQLIHQKIKKLNPKFVEDADLEFDRPGSLPKDPILRQEAIDRILEIKTHEVNEDIMKLVKKGNSLEERPKIQQICEQVKKMVKYTPSEFLRDKMRQFDQIQVQSTQALKELQTIECNKILGEFSEYKKQLDVAIKQNYDLLNQSESVRISQNLESIHEIQDKVNQLNSEYEYVQKVIEGLNITLPEIKEVDEEIEIVVPITEEKTISELDDEITRKVRQEHPELFED